MQKNNYNGATKVPQDRNTVTGPLDHAANLLTTHLQLLLSHCMKQDSQHCSEVVWLQMQEKTGAFFP